MTKFKILRHGSWLSVCAMVGLLGTVYPAQAQSAPAAAPATAGQNVVGTVTNATTGKVMANAIVKLLQLQGTMPTVATTTTDGSGDYRFSESTPGPFMVEVDNQGVPYFGQVQTGQSETNVEVYNVSHDASLVQVGAEIMVLQPDAGQLAVVNEYRVENDLKPARTLAAAKANSGLFRFRVPPGAQVNMVRVVGPNEMPLARTAQPTGDANVFVVPTPLRPGETRIQVSFRVPYATMRATLTEKPAIPPAHFEVYVPSPMTFSGAGMTQLGSQDGYNVYGASSDPIPASMSFAVAGNAPLPTAAADAAGSSSDSGTSGGGAAPTGTTSGASGQNVAVGPVPTPTFMERNQWTMLAFLGLAAAAGFGFMLSRPEAAAAQAAVAGAGTSGRTANAPAAKAATAAAKPPATAATVPAADALAKLKDDLFFLEVQHHTNRISDDEYQRQRAELDERMTKLAGRA